MISELVYTESGKLLAISDAGLIWFDGAQKPAPKKQIKFKRAIQSVFYNNKYVGISYSDPKKNDSYDIVSGRKSHLTLYPAMSLSLSQR